ncbi:MAG: hypothetical protein AW09_003273 [Candidatus Accumulibacter phosphatis]|uniref:Uncharacterized protein n=1 Tax=Candidatus Accumulibacter phosphatis TaxID=327160 RepID=A0A080M377_9PROT|nr:MAG: hypothetical protein AW09_003273 [Candidatus Accumulibacter phosphatis]
MPGSTAIGIDDDLAAGQTTVAVRAAHHEAAGRVDQIAGFTGQEFRRQNRFDDFLDHGFRDLGVRDIGIMLRGNDDGVDRQRSAVHISNRELALGVRAQPRQAAVATYLGLALHDAVRVMDR